MLLGTFLLFFVSVSIVKSQMTSQPVYTLTTMGRETAPALFLQAQPGYRVVTGRTVELYCNASTIHSFIRWSWHHLESETWREVGHSRNLNLTKPNQSGQYHCRAEINHSHSVSNIVRVHIIPMQPTEVVNFEIPGFVLSLLALIISLTVLCWLGWERLRGKPPPSSTAAKGFPAPQKAPKGGLPKTEGDGDVYINYTSNNQNYSNLDPVYMTGDNTYSSLS